VSGEGEVTYILPRHPSEIDRLDVQHYALRETLGASYLAPVERPRRILDVGSGTGQWGYDIAAEHPDALVVGLDVEASKPGQPPGYRFVRGNLLRGLPFATGSFDFVHQRLMATSAIPRAAWPGAVAELVRVAAPGGWIELVEVVVEIQPAGPATRRLLDLTRQVGRSFGLDMEAIVRSLGEQLREAGLEAVEQRDVELPVGEWGGRVGSLTASNLRALNARLFDTFEKRLGVATAELRALLTDMQVEWEEHHSKGTFVFAFGRKPGSS
jgi:SAM-dependent methyltransferase